MALIIRVHDLETDSRISRVLCDVVLNAAREAIHITKVLRFCWGTTIIKCAQSLRLMLALVFREHECKLTYLVNI
jgi:hypothetical protein